MNDTNTLIEEELSFLGTCIVYKDVLEQNVDDIRVGFFDEAMHRKIWDALVKLNGDGVQPDPQNIALYSGVKADDIQQITKSSIIDEPVFQVVKEKLIERQRVHELKIIAEEITNNDVTSDESILKLTEVIENLPQASSLDVYSNQELAKRVIKEYEEVKLGTKTLQRFSTGLPDLDHALDGGLTPSRMYVIGARPSIGKSSLAVQLYQDVLEAAGEDFTGMFVSLEMTSEALFRKQLAMVSKIPSKEIEMGQVSSEDEPLLAEGIKKLGDEMKFATVADPRLTPEGIVALARKWEKQSERKMLVLIVDYIQKIQSLPGQDEREAINHLMEQLRRYSLTDNVAVVVLSQLDRSIDNRSDKRPRALSDLKGSGNIEQDADVAMTLYRDEHYYGEDSTDPNGAEIFIVKNRWGPTADLHFTWIGALTAFADKSLKEEISGSSSIEDDDF